MRQSPSCAALRDYAPSQRGLPDRRHRRAPRVLLGVCSGLIEPKLRPPDEQIHFPTSDVVSGYSADRRPGRGGRVHGGIGWQCGHIAFWEPHLAARFDGDLDALQQEVVDLHPMTTMQNALHSFGGDWSLVPPKAATIGPANVLGAHDRSFWLDGDLGGGVSWQRFIARLVAHGPVTP